MPSRRDLLAKVLEPDAKAPNLADTKTSDSRVKSHLLHQRPSLAERCPRPSPPSRDPTAHVELSTHLSPLTEQNLAKFNNHPRAGLMRKKGSPTKKDKKKERKDRDLHPLNLPPDELRRLSELARRESARSGMEVDGTAQQGVHSPVAASPPATPSSAAPGAFPDTGGVTNGLHPPDEKSPSPPPHKVPAKPPTDPEACKVAGNKFFRARDFSRAIAEYSKAVEADPTNPTYLSNRAAAYMSNSQFRQALEDSIRAHELDASNEKIILRLARVYTSLGRPQEALDTYRLIPDVSAKDTSPAQQMLQFLQNAETVIKDEKGSGQQALWNLDQADKYLGSSVLRPRKWQLQRGEAYLKVGSANSTGEVQGIAMGLLRENQADPDALVLRGRAFYQAGDNEQAIRHFRQALQYDPDFSQARTLMKMVQRLEKAKEEGNAAFKAKSYPQAINVYTDALTIDPNNRTTNSKLLSNRALANMHMRQYENAISDCDQAVKLDPSFVKARKTRAKAIGESGNWEQAVKDLKDLAEEYPEERDLAKEIRNAELELKKSKRKDYYKILGVDKMATEAEVKKAHKKLAIQYHPDKNPGNQAAEDKFKEVQEAYETLSDPQKRERYDSGVDLMDPSDMFGGGMGGMAGMHGGMGGIDPSILLNMMGGMGGMGGGRGGGPAFTFSTGGPGGGRGGYPF